MPFVFTAGEQQFFATKGLSDPSRCADCRRVRRAQRAAEGMGPVPSTGPSTFSRAGSSPADPISRPTAGPSFRSLPREDADAEPSGSFRPDRPPVRRGGRDFEARARAATQERGPGGRKERIRARDARREEERLVSQWRDEVEYDLDA